MGFVSAIPLLLALAIVASSWGFKGRGFSFSARHAFGRCGARCAGKTKITCLQVSPHIQPGHDEGSMENWDAKKTLDWLKALPQELELSIKDIESEVVSGKSMIRALESSRELKDTFGLRSLEQRLQFEELVKSSGAYKLSVPSVVTATNTDNSKEVAATPAAAPRMPSGAGGGPFSAEWLGKVAPAYDPHMGVENMGPMLYALTRFVKPKRVLEVGAGYTSLFILQALKDNDEEVSNFVALEKVGGCKVEGWPYCDYDYLDHKSGPGILDCIDNMAHEYTTADKVRGIAAELGLEPYLRFQVEDAFTFHAKLGGSEEGEGPVDLAWVDFGAGPRLHEFFENYWDKINPNGGFILVHSTVTNNRTRTWLSEMKQTIAEINSKYGGTEYLSLWEPHKYFQNSFTIFQKRSREWQGEPIHTEYP